MNQKKSLNQLLINISNDDEAALGQLIDRIGPKLLAFCLKFTKNRSLAEELVQDTFLKLWQKRDKLKQISSFEAYIYTICKHLCLDYLRQVSRDRNLKEEISYTQELNSTYNPIEDQLMIKHYETTLQSIISTLPKRQKQIFQLSRIDGKTHKEIAQELGIALKTVDEHMSRALKAIRQKLFSYTDLTMFFILLAFL